MEIRNKFMNLESYLNDMSKGLEDKLFFVNHLPNHKKYIFLDFGCADGTLLQALSSSITCVRSPIYIGYDISEQMIEIAKTKTCSDKILFTSNWEEVKCTIRSYSEDYKVVTILSSVVHEIYSYAKSQDEIDSTFRRIMSISNYICVRDMMYSNDLDRSSLNLAENVRRYTSHAPFLKDFEEHWGSIDNLKNLVHFLLKYKWIINWDREVNENYFPVSVEDFLDIFKNEFNLIYFKRFQNAYFVKDWSSDFMIEIDDYTHIKCIFKIKK